jgi:CheY-like chemotaxis protein
MNALLAGKRVLVVEDELLVSMLIEEILFAEGCTVAGPFTTLADALGAARNETFDIALLDVNLRGERVYPVVQILTDRGIPFMFLSGYGSGAVPDDHPEWRVCAKPFTADDLIGMLTEQLQSGDAPSSR